MRSKNKMKNRLGKNECRKLIKNKRLTEKESDRRDIKI